MNNRLLASLAIVVCIGWIGVPSLAFASFFYVHTGQAINITSTSAVLEAHASGVRDRTDISFEYGDESLKLETNSAHVNDTGEKVSIRISGLLPSTRYYYRANASTVDDDDDGVTLYFTTASASSSRTEIELTEINSNTKTKNEETVQYPSVTTLSPSAIYGNSATLRGSTNTYSGEVSRAWFQYGKIGEELAPSRAMLFDARSGVFSSDVWKLSPNTDYMFRAVVENDLGISLGETRTFRTVGTQAYRAEPLISHYISVSAEDIDASDPLLPSILVHVWTAGSPVRVRVEYGTTKAMTQETEYTVLNVSGSTRITLDSMREGQSYYYRVFAQDGTSSVTTAVKRISIPRTSSVRRTSASAIRSENTEKTQTSGTIWQRLVSSFSGKESQNDERSSVFMLIQRATQNGKEVSGSVIKPKLHDLLSFSFSVTDLSYPRSGVFSFVLPEGCTYISSTIRSIDRKTDTVSGEYAFSRDTSLVINCIVDEIAEAQDVSATFISDGSKINSNSIRIGGSSGVLTSLLLGAVGFGSSTLVWVLIITILLSFVFIRIHDRILGKKATEALEA